MAIIDPIIDSIDSLMAWISSMLKQTTESYCEIETAEDEFTLVAHDGSLVSVIKIEGVKELIGGAEFNALHQGWSSNLQGPMLRQGHALQVYFMYDPERVSADIEKNYASARETAERLSLDLEDLFQERTEFMSHYCSHEEVFLVLWTRPGMLSNEQVQRAQKEKLNFIRKNKIPPFLNSQNLLAAIPDLRNSHNSWVRSMLDELSKLNMFVRLIDVHRAVYYMRTSVDPDFTAPDWQPYLPGDRIPVKEVKRRGERDLSGLMYPPLGKQILPRDAEIIDLRTVRIGDRIYTPLFIDLFPQEVRTFGHLFHRVLPANIPWRMSFHIEAGGIKAIRFKSMLAGLLSFASEQNKLLNRATEALHALEIRGDDAAVKLQVSLATWAPYDDLRTLRIRSAELAKAVEGWGTCEVSEICGDPFGGVASSMMGVSMYNVANPSVAPLSDVIMMLPITRPASSWESGAVLFRTPDGKPWPYQPGSSQQTTWIDLVYARPGSGKSVLSNTTNLALCLSAGIPRLPRISIIDIGPSSSGLISLLKEALPLDKKHYVAYHRLRMTSDYAINPFDTQLGCRAPSPQERAFLVNFLTLLATPVGATRPYDGIIDMAGLVVDQLYDLLADNENPRLYTSNLEPLVDDLLEEIGFVKDPKTSWWEVTDALFVAGFPHEAMLAQRYAVPLLADAASICREKSIEDLYGKVTTPTGESLINAFARMVSSAVREYPILSQVTKFDLGEARIVSLDLDEVAKTGGDAADRQTAVMYMLARYILGKNFYITKEGITEIPDVYKEYHKKRFDEISEDPKRLVMDEFHRTSKAQAVRDQVIVDMREGRKWNVQIAVLSQSLEDFDSTMVEFATSIFIMDAGPASAVKKTTETFGLTETGTVALQQNVHGPRAGGATFLAQFATKNGMNVQLLTSTIGPIELWAFSTTSEDANLRNRLYQHLGPKIARQVLARLFPNGSAKAAIEKRLERVKQATGQLEAQADQSVIAELVNEIVENYRRDPDFASL